MSDVHDSSLAPFQAGLRFVIELAALVCWGIVGRQVGGDVGGDVGGWVLAAVLPVSAAALWGTFRVPGDRSASGRAPVAVPGRVRLAVELVVLLGAATAVAVTWRPVVGLVLAVAIVVHYAATVRRVRWLIAAPTVSRTS